MEKLPEKIIFFSDAHLGLYRETKQRTDILADFLSSIKGTVSHIYIVGDLFDFWFEYDNVIPAVAPKVIFELYNLVKAGTDVTIFAGNHDYWFGKYITESVGLKVISNGAAVRHQGHKIYLHHGDGLYPDDHGYRILKKVLRNKFAISLFRLIHPDLAYKIARLTSSTSRNYLGPAPEENHENIKIYRETADKKISDGFDTVIFGHSHIPLLENRGNGKLVLLGDWINHFTYLALENEKFSLLIWDPKINNDSKHEAENG